MVKEIILKRVRVEERPGNKDKDVSAFTDTGTGKYDVSKRAQDKKAVIDYAKGKLDFQKVKNQFFTGPGTFKQTIIIQCATKIKCN